jgi:hypothetical protein
MQRSPETRVTAQQNGDERVRRDSVHGAFDGSITVDPDTNIGTTRYLLVVLLVNGPRAPWIRPDLLGRPRRVGGGCATPMTPPDKAEISGSSPHRPTR